MKLAANLLIAISLALALISASSAYLVDLRRSDGELLGATLNELVRVLEPGSLTRRTVGERGATLDAELLAALRAADVTRVRVEEFAFSRWNERWLFLLALFGLGAGAVLARQAAKLAVARVASAGGGRGGPSPSDSLAAIAAIVDELLRAWPQRGDDGPYVLERLSLAIDDHGPAFVAARDLLVARLGLGGYATLMDRFAGAERQLHRAWSAAADDILEETHTCLTRARIVLAEARVALEAASV